MLWCTINTTTTAVVCTSTIKNFLYVSWNKCFDGFTFRIKAQRKTFHAQQKAVIFVFYCIPYSRVFLCAALQTTCDTQSIVVIVRPQFYPWQAVLFWECCSKAGIPAAARARLYYYDGCWADELFFFLPVFCCVNNRYVCVFVSSFAGTMFHIMCGPR